MLTIHVTPVFIGRTVFVEPMQPSSYQPWKAVCANEVAKLQELLKGK